jgi:nucleotide-binding universal stress UspA family protein
MGTTLSAFLVNIFEVLLFNLTGLLAGIYGDARQGYFITREIPYAPSEVKKRFLLLVDGTPFSLYAANYFARIFGKAPDVGVTLMWVFTRQDTDFFESSEAASSYNREEYRTGERILEQAKEVLIGGGIAERNIQVKVSAADKKSRASDKILEEVRKGAYDTIVVGKHPGTKAQEFLFGSTTINLVRGAPISVIAVKMPPGEGKPEEAG